MNLEVSQTNREELVEKLDAYLSGQIDHETIQSYAWFLSDSAPKEPSVIEKDFWSSVFSIIHLADDKHWKGGSTQRDLGELLNQLRGSNS